MQKEDIKQWKAHHDRPQRPGTSSTTPLHFTRILSVQGLPHSADGETEMEKWRDLPKVAEPGSHWLHNPTHVFLPPKTINSSEGHDYDLVESMYYKTLKY